MLEKWVKKGVAEPNWNAKVKRLIRITVTWQNTQRSRWRKVVMGVVVYYKLVWTTKTECSGRVNNKTKQSKLEGVDNDLLNTQLYFIAIQSSTAFDCIFDTYCNIANIVISFHWLLLFYHVFIYLFLFVCFFVCKMYLLFYWSMSCSPILQLSILKKYFYIQHNISASLPAADPRNDWACHFPFNLIFVSFSFVSLYW